MKIKVFFHNSFFPLVLSCNKDRVISESNKSQQDNTIPLNLEKNEEVL